MTYRWHFDIKRPTQKERNPIQGEFFATEAIDKPGEALVREGIQNSLDARRNGEKVKVWIRVSGQDGAVERGGIQPFLSGLQDHLDARGNGLRYIPTKGENCPFLVFEDFGTKGLLGDPAECQPVDGSHNDFHDFFRAEGRSDKSKKDIGRWGIGKQVFPRASRINSIFGLTVRRDDRRALLMGMAVLKTHDVNGQRYNPDGWFGILPGNDSNEPVIPIEHDSCIKRFCKLFGLQRGNDPGLSIVVPWCDLEMTDENLVRAVLRGYFWPILKGRLEVIVETPSIPTILDANSLEPELKKIGGELGKDILPLVELSKWAGTLSESGFWKLNSPPTGKGWQWSRDLFPEDSLPSIRDRYEAGERLGFRVHVDVRKKGDRLRPTHFDVFLVRDGTEQSGRPVFIREGIIIPNVRRYGFSILHGVRTLVIAEDEGIASFLGDSENPAHTEWQKNGANFKGVYEDGPKILDFITHSAKEIVRIICEQDKKEDKNLLADFFSISAPPDLDTTRTRAKQKPEGKGKEPEHPEPPEPRPKQFLIDRIAGGFVVRNGDRDGVRAVKSLLIRAAYQVRRGNPFMKYHPADFDLSRRMQVRLEGATVLAKEGNRLQVRIDKKDFRIEVTGFDPKRDVRVEVPPKEVVYDDSDD